MRIVYFLPRRRRKTYFREAEKKRRSVYFILLINFLFVYSLHGEIKK